MRAWLAVGLVLAMGTWGACGGDAGTAADRLGVGAQCKSNDGCLRQGDGGINLSCLTQFKGGYCGLEACTSNADCPDPSVCVAHDDGKNYCFRTCADKPECNVNRAADVEANCSANVTLVDPKTKPKACVPPSGS